MLSSRTAVLVTVSSAQTQRAFGALVAPPVAVPHVASRGCPSLPHCSATAVRVSLAWSSNGPGRMLPSGGFGPAGSQNCAPCIHSLGHPPSKAQPWLPSSWWPQDELQRRPACLGGLLGFAVPGRALPHVCLPVSCPLVGSWSSQPPRSPASSQPRLCLVPFCHVLAWLSCWTVGSQLTGPCSCLPRRQGSHGTGLRRSPELSPGVALRLTCALGSHD